MKTWSKFIYWLWARSWFIDHINFCEPNDSQGKPKAGSFLYDLFYKVFWYLPPWPEVPGEECWCCAAMRALVFGFIAGCIAMKVWVWL